ncbi:MAG: IS200/IS605 family transposase [Planctomycetes bacterium]|nr:IS200/IS605 family transposase [Planctomycetota bacterium]
MAQSLAKILVHIVFSTKGRVPSINLSIEPELHAYMATVLRRLESLALEIGGSDDHVHVLCSLGRKVSVADLIKELKHSSSGWIKSKGGEYRSFYWQGGYAAFSIGESGVAACRTYIRNQRVRHRKVSFQDELRALLSRYRVEFDERYVWD